MANPRQREPLRSSGLHHSAVGHRVDEVHIHERKHKLAVWPWLLLLAGGLLLLWGVFGRREASTNTVTACDPATLRFSAGSSAISATDRGAIQALASCLKANPDSKVRLEGRAGSVEGPELAQSRAEVIGRELRARGVPSAQFSVGTGAAVCSEATDACEQTNRSVTAVPQRRK